MAVSSWCLVAVVLILLGALLWRLQTSVRWFIFYLTTDIPGPTLWQCATVYAKRYLSGEFLGIVHELCLLHDRKPWGTWMLGEYYVFISDAHSVTEVMKSKHTLDKPTFMYANLAKFSNGLFSLNGDTYKRHRKLMSWAFRKDLLHANLPWINEEFEKIVSELDATKGETADMCIMPYVLSLATSLHIISGKFTELSGNFNEFVMRFKSCLKIVHDKTLNPVKYWLTRSNWENEKQVHLFLDRLKGYFLDARNYANPPTEDDGRPANHFDVMSAKTKEDQFTDEEFFEETKTLLSAAFETTGTAKSACLYFLALNPEVQNRAYAEIKAIFGESHRAVESEDLSQMVFVEKVIKEALRLIPPGALLARRAQESITLNGVKAPRGCVIVTNIWVLHRNPEFFPDPLKFDPERFAPENSADRPQFAHLPFSGGPRQCPGQAQSFLVIKTFLCHILRNFEILPGEGLQSLEDIKLKYYVVIEFPHLPLRFIRRDCHGQLT